MASILAASMEIRKGEANVSYRDQAKEIYFLLESYPSTFTKT